MRRGDSLRRPIHISRTGLETGVVQGHDDGRVRPSSRHATHRCRMQRRPVLTIRATSFLEIAPALIVAAMGWSGVGLCVAGALGCIPVSGSPLAGLVITGIFVAIGHWFLLTYAVKVEICPERWGVRKGIWPFRSSTSGDLSEASHLAIARETRNDEGAEDPVLVVRIEWRDPGRKPLVLTERPIHNTKLDCRPALAHWAGKIGELLDLPLEILES